MANDNIKLSSSTEDYLEMIYLIDNQKKNVRVKDISSKMGVTMPSVNQALTILCDHRLVNHEKYGYIELTARGRKRAIDIYSRHKILFRFLNDILDVPEEIAEQDACSIEHSISPSALDGLLAFVEFVDTYPLGRNPQWMQSFMHFRKTGKRPSECEDRIKRSGERKKVGR